jgi:hypothetical protein
MVDVNPLALYKLYKCNYDLLLIMIFPVRHLMLASGVKFARKRVCHLAASAGGAVGGVVGEFARLAVGLQGLRLGHLLPAVGR